MKHVAYTTFIFLLLTDFLCAEDIVVEFKGHTGGIYAVSFSLDGNKAITTGADKTVRIWNTETGKELRKWETTNLYYRTLGKIQNDLANNMLLSGIIKPTLDGAYSSRFSPDGKKIAIAMRDGTIKIHDAESGEELQKLVGYPEGLWHFDFSPDGKKIVGASRNKSNGDIREGTALIFDVESGKKLLVLRHTDRGEYSNGLVCSVAFSPDGTSIVTGSADETARIWDANSGKELLTLDSGNEFQQREKGYVYAVLFTNFSPDGKKIVTAAQHGVTHIWDAESGKVLQKLEHGISPINYIAYSPDSKNILAVHGAERTIRIWDAESGMVVQKLEGQAGCLCIHPDGKKSVILDVNNTLKIRTLEWR